MPWLTVVCAASAGVPVRPSVSVAVSARAPVAVSAVAGQVKSAIATAIMATARRVSCMKPTPPVFPTVRDHNHRMQVGRTIG